MTEDPYRRFEEKIRSLVSDGGETTTDISRLRVEQIGEDLGIGARDACARFFDLRGSVWDVADLAGSTIHSQEASALPPPRNWLGINDVYLVT